MLPAPPQCDRTLPFLDGPPASWEWGSEQTPRVSALWRINVSLSKDLLVKDLLDAHTGLGAEEVTEVLLFSVPVHKVPES